MTMPASAGRAQRTRTIRRRATVASLGVLLGAFATVAATTHTSDTPTTAAPASSITTAASAPLSPGGTFGNRVSGSTVTRQTPGLSPSTSTGNSAASAAPIRRMRTRQS